MRALSSVIFFLSLAIPSLGQSTCEQQIVVNVRDSHAGFVPDLQASSFRAKVGGREATISSVVPFEGATRLIVVLDASGSMRGLDGRWTTTKQIAESIIAFAPGSMKLALLVFNKQIVRKLDFGHSRKDLFAAIEQLPDADGLTATWSSLLQASDMFGDPAPGDALVVISDFGDNADKTKPSEVERAFLAKRVRLFGIITSDRFFTDEEREGSDVASALVKHTGGNANTNIVKSAKDHPSFLKQLFDEIARFYVVKLTQAVPLRKPERLNLDLVAADGKKNKGILLYYPQHLTLCAP